MTSAVMMHIVDNVAVIEVDNPPVNALSFAVRSGLQTTLREAEHNEAVDAIVLSCRGNTFIAGADITEFGKPMQPPALPDLLSEMDTLTKPMVAALHGTALGGGLEVALTCHYRVALESAKVGLPEVLLGILPGAGGTQRLPRIAGVELALDMITSGRKVSSKEAAKAGLIDKVVSDDLQNAAIAFAKEVVSNQAPLRRISELTATASDPAIFDQYRAKLAKTRRGFDAPQRCVDTVQAAVELDFAEGMKKERELFLELMQGTQSKSQRHMFFAERMAAQVQGLSKGTPTRDINSVAIIGAGTMGSGIAINFTNKGIPVTMLELSFEALERGIKHIHRYYDGQVAKGRISEEQAAAAKQLVSGTDNYADLGDVDLVIEAVFESMAVKQDVFTKLDKYCKPGAILASNTSTLNVNTIASFTSRPQDVIGLHFFSPANIMRLLEVVRADSTADDVLATAMKLAKHINKVGVVSGVCDGFIGNRMLKGYGREAGALLLEGVSPARIDKALYDFGMAMGPLTMGDLAGLDVGYRVRKERRERGEYVPETDGAIADRLVEAGRLGQKAGKGYYRYEEGSRTPIPDPEVDAIIKEAMDALGCEPREIDDEEIVKRLIYPLINEAALILDEGIAQRPSDIDVVYIYGYGFPVYRGGPMFYADTVGLPAIVADMEQFQARYGDDWQVAPLLKTLAEQGRSFADLSSKQLRREIVTDAVIVSTARTPIGKAYRGSFNNTHGAELAGHAIAQAVQRAGIDGAEVEDVLIGCGLPEGATGGNIGRQAALMAGLPVTTAGVTINRFCSSGLQAISMAAQRIIVDGAPVAVAGGLDSISLVQNNNMNKFRAHSEALKAKHSGIYLSMIETAEIVAKRYGISREQMDEYALQSQQRTAAAQQKGIYDNEIVPMDVVHAQYDKTTDTTELVNKTATSDECNRPTTTLDGLAGLNPVIDGGTITAGNASQLSDGASASVMMSAKEAQKRNLPVLGTYRGMVVTGCEPDEMGIGPVFAVPKLLKRHGLTVNDIDLWELNEAFAVQVLYCRDKLGIDNDKLNVNGGAISIGHPYGMSGARMVGHALLEGQRRKARYAVTTMCIGGGMGMAALFEINS